MAGREERRKRGEERQREEGYLTTMRWWPERRRRRAETASLGEAGIDGGEVAGLLSWWTWGSSPGGRGAASRQIGRASCRERV